MTDHYTSLLASRYASAEMSAIFSPYSRYTTWRQLWIALAKAQKQLGLTISQEQIEEMQEAYHSIDFAKAAAYEKNSVTMSWRIFIPLQTNVLKLALLST